MTTHNTPALPAHLKRGMVTVTDHILPVIKIPMPLPSTVQPLVGAVVLIVRSAGGTGADTLAALLEDQASRCGVPVTLVDFEHPGDEGPAWHRIPGETHQIKMKIGVSLGAELGNEIADRPRDLVLINAPTNSLPDFCAAEATFGEVIRMMARPYYIFWIDAPHDEPLDTLVLYELNGGKADCVVFARETGARAQATAMRLPTNQASVVGIPCLPGAVADAFYKKRETLERAFTRGRTGDQISMSMGLKKFMRQLGDTL